MDPNLPIVKWQIHSDETPPPGQQRPDEESGSDTEHDVEVSEVKSE